MQIRGAAMASRARAYRGRAAGLRHVAAAGVLAVGLAACGGDGGDDTADTADTDTGSPADVIVVFDVPDGSGGGDTVDAGVIPDVVADVPGATDAAATTDASSRDADGAVDGLDALASPAALCVDTGGVWEGDRCACAQDGVSRHYEFDPESGCGPPSDDDLAAMLADMPLAAIVAEAFEPEVGGWVIDRPGAFDAVHRVETLADVEAVMSPDVWGPISEQAGTCVPPLHRDGLPEVSCEGDGEITPAGCFLVDVAGTYARVSDLMELANEFGFGAWSEEEIEAARAAEALILRASLNSEHAVTLAFRRFEGRWVLTVIDLARYSCSA